MRLELNDNSISEDDSQTISANAESVSKHETDEPPIDLNES
jgi:hypothetical protein